LIFPSSRFPSLFLSSLSFFWEIGDHILGKNYTNCKFEKKKQKGWKGERKRSLAALICFSLWDPKKDKRKLFWGKEKD